MYICDACMCAWSLDADLYEDDKDEEPGQGGYTTEFRVTSV